MVCFKCGKEYDDSLSACPGCGAGVAVPVIPDISVTMPKAKKSSLPPVKEQKAAPAKAVMQAPAEGIITAEGQPASAADGSKKIIAVLSVLLVIMTATVVLLLIDRSRLTAKEEPTTYKSSAAQKSTKKAAKKGSVDTANEAAELVYKAAVSYATQRENVGMPVPFGAVCSSYDVGMTSTNILVGAVDTERELTDIVSKYLGEDFANYQWFVCFNGGMPVSAYAAADCDTHFIGSYPTAATGETLISFRDGSEIVNFDTVDAYKSANDIY